MIYNTRNPSNDTTENQKEKGLVLHLVFRNNQKLNNRPESL